MHTGLLNEMTAHIHIVFVALFAWCAVVVRADIRTRIPSSHLQESYGADSGLEYLDWHGSRPFGSWFPGDLIPDFRL